MTGSLRAVLAVAIALAAGCAGNRVRVQTTATGGLIATARHNGAQRCAPVELAMAESHNDFARHALDEGNYSEARTEADVAETNAQLAIDRSPPATCVDKDVPLPGPGDLDGDGVLDDVDQCPRVPEDKDGFQDEDGCPDPDNDKDGVPDVTDKCPDEPGVPPDGCPKKYNLVVVTETKIELKQTVFFDTNRATIKRVSFALLTEVAQALKDNPTIKVEIQGHTDSQGSDRANLKLSQKRAESVRTYLIKKAVTSDRMVAKGYGESTPIADNRTAEGRSQNRRVEFVITAR